MRARRAKTVCKIRYKFYGHAQAGKFIEHNHPNDDQLYPLVTIFDIARDAESRVAIISQRRRRYPMGEAFIVCEVPRIDFSSLEERSRLPARHIIFDHLQQAVGCAVMISARQV